MAFRSEIYNGINLVLIDNSLYQRAVTDITFYKSMAGIF